MAAFLVGVAKTAIGGVATIAVAIGAAVMPTRESTAALLLMLLVGDVLAVSLYHRACDWRLIRQLLPGVLPGLVLGTAVLAVIDDAALRRGMGALLLVLLLLQLFLRRAASGAGPDGIGRPWGRPARVATGVGAGFTTMAANAAGAVMTLYLLSQRIDKLGFLGTSAWFFLCVNLAKVPFSAGLGLTTVPMMIMAVLLAPLVVVGGLIGARLVQRLHQRSFELAVLVASAVSAGALLIP